VTITAWRIVKEERADAAMSGEGARRYGGRWNAKGTPAVYLSSSLSLAVLEILFHLPSPRVLDSYVVPVPN
jgi:RES domain-containing protein